MAMNRLTGILGALALLIFAGGEVRAMYGEGTCDRREGLAASMAEDGSRAVAYSLRPVYLPLRGEDGESVWTHTHDEEISVWVNDAGQIGFVASYLHTDPQWGEVVWSCIEKRGSGAKPHPVLHPSKGA